METKTCLICKIEKNLGEFHKEFSNRNSPNPAGRVKARCRDCVKRINRERDRNQAILGPDFQKGKLCQRCGQIKPLMAFRRAKGSPDGFLEWCFECGQIPREDYARDPARKKARYDRKINEIKAQGCICPGCKEDFKSCSDRALFMIFEKSHVHGKSCRKNNKDHSSFLSCRLCNSQQKDICGSWNEAGEFVELACRSEEV